MLVEVEQVVAGGQALKRVWQDTKGCAVLWKEPPDNQSTPGRRLVAMPEPGTAGPPVERRARRTLIIWEVSWKLL